MDEAGLVTLVLMAVFAGLLFAGLAILLLRKAGLRRPAPHERRAQALQQTLRLHPALTQLPPHEQQRIVDATHAHPVLLVYAAAVVAGLIAAALSFPALLDFINRGARSAALVGIGTMAVLILGIFGLRKLLIIRAIRRSGQ